MAKLDEEIIVELIGSYNSTKGTGDFDEELAWRLVRDRVALEASANATAAKTPAAKKERVILLYDPAGKIPAGTTLMGYNMTKNTEVGVLDSDTETDENGLPIEVKAWSTEETQLDGLLELVHEDLMDDNTNKYSGKGLTDMIRYGKKVMKNYGVEIKGDMFEVLVVSNSTIPMWVNRAPKAGS